ncbi:MAG: energy transducer TonB [Bacteroidia bacterium]|nr:energy transducer TonB [Bacteroidia bacterium]
MKTSVLTTILMLFTSVIFSQSIDTSYIDKWFEECSKDISYFYKVNNLDSNYSGIETVFVWTGQKYSVKSILNGSYSGPATWWYKNGQKAIEGSYKNGLLDGKLIRWYPNGIIQSEEIYEKGIGNDNDKHYNESGKIIYSLVQVEKYPFFENTNSKKDSYDAIKKYLNKHAQLFKWSKLNDIQGVIKVYYTITEQGKVVDVAIYDEVNYFLDKEAIRIVKNMPKFNPAVKDGKCVKIRTVAKVEFKKSLK